MKPEEQAFIEFLHWLDVSDFVPQQTKTQFLEHVAKTGKLDKKATQFIEHAFKLAENRQAQTQKTLSDEWEMLNAALQVQKQPEHSLELKIAEAGSKRMHGQVQKFKTHYHKVEGQKRAQAESVEHEVELDQVAALKASVGA